MLEERINSQKKWNIEYPVIPSVIRPVACEEGLPVPDFPANIPTDSDMEDDRTELAVLESVPITSDAGTSFEPTSTFFNTRIIKQNKLQGLIRDLEHLKNKLN